MQQWLIKMSKIVIALGGNALGASPSEQLSKLKSVAKIIVSLIESGNKVVITHGNGPQVGQIVLAMDYAASGTVKTPIMPFPECGSMSQGYIGYQLEQALQNELNKRKIAKNCVTVITQVQVDAKDEAFLNPTKPIGMFYSKKEAMRQKRINGFTFVEDAGRGYRRVVPSPKPIKIIEEKTIKSLVDAGNVVIACGGGGVPVIVKRNTLEGVPAVIDKDKTAALLARNINADVLLILTAVDKVYLNFKTSSKIALTEMNYAAALKYMQAGEFAKGSMLPKVEACLEFVKNSSKKAIISSLDHAKEAIEGKTGTIIKWR